MKRPDSVLIMKLDHIGDTLLITPAIRALRSFFREARIFAMATPLTYPVLAGNPDLDHLMVYDPPGSHRSASSRLAFVRNLKERQFSLIISFSASVRDYLMAWMSGGGERAGYYYEQMWVGRMLSALCLTRRISCPDDPARYRAGKLSSPLRHEVEQNLEVVSSLGVPVERSPLILPVGEEDRQSAMKHLRDAIAGIAHGLEAGAGHDHAALGIAAEEKRIVVVQLSHRWFWEKAICQGVADLLKEICRRFPAHRVVATYQEGEEKLKEMVFQRLREGKIPENLVPLGGLSLKEFAALLSKASLAITMHSGVTHIAAATGVPVLVVFKFRHFDYFSTKEAPWLVPSRLIRTPWEEGAIEKRDEEEALKILREHILEIADEAWSLCRSNAREP